MDDIEQETREEGSETRESCPTYIADDDRQPNYPDAFSKLFLQDIPPNGARDFSTMTALGSGRSEEQPSNGVKNHVNNSVESCDIRVNCITPGLRNSYSDDVTTTLLPSNNSITSSTDRMHCEISVQTDNEDGEEGDTFSSKLDIEKINSIKSKRSRSSSKKSRRKESFEQRLRRTFTIKDEHTNEVTKRIIAILIKYSLFVFNFMSWVMASGAIGMGIWMLTDRTAMVTDDTDFFLDPPLVICIAGSVTFVVAFLGCVGALRENLILLKLFFYVLSVILLGELTLAVAVFIIYTVPEARDNFLRSQPEKILGSAIQKYMDEPEVKIWLDTIQSKLQCCGISQTDEGFRDWQMNPYFNCTPSNKSIYRCAVPTSCCIFEKGDRVNTMCGFAMTDKPLLEVKDYIHTRGCIHGFGEWLGKYDDLIIISSLSVLIMQLLAVLSAKVMVIRIRKQQSRWKVLQRSSTRSTSPFPRYASETAPSEPAEEPAEEPFSVEVNTGGTRSQDVNTVEQSIVGQSPIAIGMKRKVEITPTVEYSNDDKNTFEFDC